MAVAEVEARTQAIAKERKDSQGADSMNHAIETLWRLLEAGLWMMGVLFIVIYITNRMDEKRWQ